MIVERKEYLDKLISWKDKRIIKIVTGVRRCGKSMLLKIYQNYLKNQGIDENQIIAINFEDLDYEELTDYKKLYAYLKERLIEGKMTYIFLDEIADYTAQGISVVFYNHRQRKAEDIYFSWIREMLNTQSDLCDCPFSKITFPKCSVRDYILLAARPDHQKMIDTALNSLLSGPFGQKGLCR